MARKAAAVSEMELAILEVLWKRGPSRVREIVDVVYAEHNHTLHATVSTLLSRLRQKKLIDRDDTDRVRRFSARISRNTYVEKLMEQFAKSHFDGSLLSLVLSLVERTNLPRADRDAIRKIIEGHQ